MEACHFYIHYIKKMSAESCFFPPPDNQAIVQSLISLLDVISLQKEHKTEQEKYLVIQSSTCYSH